MRTLALGILASTALCAQGLIGVLGGPTAEQAGARPMVGSPGISNSGAYRVGNGVSAPRPLGRVDPSYSAEGRACQIQGSVVLQIVIGANGTASEFRIRQSLGFGLDEQAVAAVRLWPFLPGMLNGKLVPVEANVEVNFQVREARARLTDTCTTYLDGVRLLTGNGKAKDEAAGVTLIEAAAAMDFAEAQLRLAGLYEYGDGGVTLDNKHAERLYRACAKTRLVRCQAGLGRVLVSDSMNRVEGMAWLELAAQGGSADAQDLFSSELKLTPEDQLAQARAMEKILLPK